MPRSPSCALLPHARVCPLGTQAPVPARMSRAVPGPLCTHWPALCLATANPKSLFAGYWVGRCWDSSFPPPQPPALIISGSKGSLWHKHRDTHTLTSLRPLLQESSIPGPPPHHLMLQLLLQRDASPRQVPDGNTDVGEERRGIAASTYSFCTEHPGSYTLPRGCSWDFTPHVVNQG